MPKESETGWEGVRYLVVVVLIYLAYLLLQDMNAYSQAETKRLKQDSVTKALEKSRHDSLKTSNRKPKKPAG
ncbi:hypothetical protein GO755_00135 [Spirosoma sp. HMF4905]|uniref:Uncharacterized protein n=1 Tax=Spirosoma arboris TaxID=2682092 RepID=A0A7K1S3M5_9BACT|nr:hypothetical protein [Spirosoma arboris]MVM28419.1 hypothetical protein [Spirosoma arboris]